MQKGGGESTFLRQRRLQMGKNPCLNTALEDNLFPGQMALYSDR
ncbi:hypothetical protein LEP1GSC034_2383 [Leptospira interrogans str. 2003000735]|uniref:Uncharacterized protein n=11 Tax=Leptospira interrogans TaxID=173 RepID=M7A7S5_LEPIR|nr:hypothetical protein [Leptospira interrogans]EJP02734.1 hypothetical protein LEP1GSC007_4245 [Leptospira interrogans serovar Bulgarica str. Mallika]EJP15672.1 hypothetical protein LEP1GSC080_3873 [Leptospira interrogans str. FPW2026]EKN87264.1 hypothetical protein LEP1GSC027_3183 [Leptospira interrogans str. 2002000624]EKO23076.1 hypothetical protein LEP1GSC104_4194 [Leptospira interrogans str. UI 12621]EKO72134.1 hypothetical protein LEP1GSC069_1008 [Leptospira interrogans serovar Canicola